MSILTNYRPNFCCQCGHKIVRLRWRVWTSRRFCDKCFRTFSRAHWLRPTLSLAGLLLLGILIGRGCRHAPPPLVIERPVPTKSVATSPPASASDSATSAPREPAVAEQVYLCGARTKKGTPCSRRVHGPVRCWQHKGAPAMLPQEKLRIN